MLSAKLTKYKIHYKETLMLALPIIIAQIGQSLTNIVDNLMIGNYNTIDLAAAGFSNSIFVIFLVFAIGFSIGLTPKVGKANAKGKEHLLKHLFQHSLLLNMLFISVLFFVMLLTMQHLSFFGQSDEVVNASYDYLFINALSLFPMMLFSTGKQFADGLQYTKASMYIILISNIINFLINYVLIYGAFGFPELGLVGAGIGTLSARIFMAIGMFYMLFSHQKFKFLLQDWFKQKIRKKLLKDQFLISFPISLQLLLEVAAFAMGAIIVGTLGAKQLAAHQIVLGLITLTFMMITSVGSAVTIRVSNFMGEKQFYKAKLSSYAGLHIALVFMITTSLFFALNNHFLPALHTFDEEVLAYASTMMLIAALFQISDGVQAIASASLRGLPDVKIPTLLAFVSYWVFALPLGYYLSNYTSLSELGVWAGFTIGLAFSSVTLVWRLNHQFKKINC